MSLFQIVDSSPESERIAKYGHERKSEPMYPFDELNVGKSFTVPAEQANIASLRASAHRKSKNGKRFVVVRHTELNPPLIEVARVE